MSTATAPAKLVIDSKVVETIRKEHEQCVSAHWQAVEHARAAGTKLLEVKAEFASHNEGLPRKERVKFSKWVEKELHITRRTASNYMRVADRWTDLKRSELGDWTMRGVLAFLRRQDGGVVSDAKPATKTRRRVVRVTKAAFAKVANRHKVSQDALTKVLEELGVTLEMV